MNPNSLRDTVEMDLSPENNWDSLKINRRLVLKLFVCFHLHINALKFIILIKYYVWEYIKTLDRILGLIHYDLLFKL